MRAEIPEDLSELPDVDRTLAAPAPARDEPPPEDLAQLPEAPEAPQAEQGHSEQVTRSGPGLAALLVGGLLGLALLAVALEVTDALAAGFAVHPALGWTVAGLVVAVTAAAGLLVSRELHGYLRLSSFENLKATYRELAEKPKDHDLHAAARRQVREFLAAMEEAAGPELLVRLQRVRERMDLTDDPLEWREDIERVLLAPMDEKAREAVRREAVNVALGTAVSPSGLLDGLIAVWRNIRLIKEMAGIYRVRAGAYGSYVILRRSIASAALADLAQEASVAVLGTTRSLARFVGAPLAQAVANATLTIRLGMKAQEECRPLALPQEKKVNTARMLAGSVRSAVRRVSRRGKDMESDEPEEARTEPES